MSIQKDVEGNLRKQSKKKRKTIEIQTEISGMFIDEILKKLKVMGNSSNKGDKNMKITLNHKEPLDEPFKINSNLSLMNEKPEMVQKSIQVCLDSPIIPNLNLKDISNEDKNNNLSAFGKSSNQELNSFEERKKPGMVKIQYKFSQGEVEDQNSASSEYIPPVMTSTDRKNIEKVQKYEHKFMKTSDNVTNIHPVKKNMMKTQKFSDYIGKKFNSYFYLIFNFQLF